MKVASKILYDVGTVSPEGKVMTSDASEVLSLQTPTGGGLSGDKAILAADKAFLLGASEWEDMFQVTLPGAGTYLLVASGTVVTGASDQDTEHRLFNVSTGVVPGTYRAISPGWFHVVCMSTVETVAGSHVIKWQAAKMYNSGGQYLQAGASLLYVKIG